MRVLVALERLNLQFGPFLCHLPFYFVTICNSCQWGTPSHYKPYLPTLINQTYIIFIYQLPALFSPICCLIKCLISHTYLMCLVPYFILYCQMAPCMELIPYFNISSCGSSYMLLKPLYPNLIRAKFSKKSLSKTCVSYPFDKFFSVYPITPFLIQNTYESYCWSLANDFQEYIHLQ